MKEKVCKFSWYLIILLLFSACQNNLCSLEIKEPVSLNEKYPNLTFGILASAAIAELNKDILFCFNSKKYPVDIIEKRVGVKSTSDDFFFRLENFIEDEYIEYFSKTTPDKPEDNSYWTLKRHVMDAVTGQIIISEEAAKEVMSKIQKIEKGV